MSWIPGGLFFFRAQFRSGFDQIGGDNGDARLVVVLHEHWIDVFRGRVSWTSPPFFFPFKGTLGYTDTFFLNQVFYAPLRAAGLDEFLAFQWTVVLLSIVGFVGMFVLLRRVVGVSLWGTFALATTFAFANNLYIKAAHPQLYSVYWLPLLVLVLVRTIRSRRRSEQVLWGALAGGLLGLILFSTYYIGWFAIFIGAIYLAVFALLRWRAGGGRALVAACRRRIAALAGWLIGLAVTLIPFFVLYVPVLRQIGGRRYEDVMFYYAPHPAEVLNLGANNYLWGSLARTVLEPAELINSETSLALTPVLLLLTLAAGIVAWRLRRRAQAGLLASWCVAGAVTVAALTVLPLHFGVGSLWRLPWEIVPGSSGIRAIDRLQVVAGPLACVTVAVGLATVIRGVHWRRPERGRLAAMTMAAVLVVPVIEQINFGANAYVDRSVEVERLTETPFAPTGCQLFFVIDSATPPHSFAQSSVDALLIAQRTGIPTVNGYSGQYPAGYGLSDPTSPDYQAQVRNWVIAKEVEPNLCSYDIDLRIWTHTP